MSQQQRTQYHQAAFGGQKFRRRDVEFLKDEFRQPVEGKDLQSRETGNFPAFQQLAFELERGLFGREQDERRAVGRLRQHGADFGETSERLAAARRTEEKARLHKECFTQKRRGGR